MMPHTPLVSIAVITYNQVHLLAETLDSCLQQTYPHIEIVVADDASTDGAQDLLRAYQTRYPDKIRLVLAEKNAGITANSNAALFACQGEYIALLGGDDICLPTRIEKQLQWFLQNPEGAICLSDVEVFQSETNQTIEIYRNQLFYQSASIEKIIAQDNQTPSSALMVRQAYCKHLYFDPRTPVVSDWLYVIEGCIAGQQGYIPEVLLRYRRHAHNITQGGFNKSFLDDRLIYCDILLSRYPQYHRAAQKQRSNVFYFSGLRALFDKNFTIARYLALQAISSKVFSPRNYILLISTFGGGWFVNFIQKYKSMIRQLMRFIN